MSLYEVLKASKTNRFPDYWTLLWGRKMSASMIKTITGVLPLTFTAKGGTTADWVIYGNDDNGTENFFGDYETFPSTHISYVNAWTSYGGGGICQRVKCEGNTEYTLSFANTSSLFRISASSTNDVPTANNPVIVQRLVNTTNSNSETFTTPNNAKFIIVQISFDEQELLNSAMLVKGSTAPDHYIPYQQGVGEQRADGYYVPLTISQAGQPDKTVGIYIGDTPLTEGETVSKTSTGVDIELFKGENTVSTTLYNKPTMEIKYK